MRQAGVLAAAGLIALEESPKRLHHDHENAQHLAKGLAAIKGIALDPAKVVTNIVIFDVSGTGPHRRGNMRAARQTRKSCARPTDKYSVRMVTHCDVDRAGIDTALAAVAQIATEKAPAAAAN